MASKLSRTGNQKVHVKNGDKDDLDLRDEILGLKREITALRKERDKLLVRLRKSEDESKRKDKQIEQLMDPSQNSEIRRLLSMKGAALLLNLKDQNNTLVQMLMEKNQQMKRLSSEVRTAKLYSRTNKTEPYRIEISRLRSLLLQSQEALKEAAHGPHVETACMSGHSSSSSDEVMHSPQELEELRFMVHSLETHMQYSKELLSKKNQEISTLSHELKNIMEGHCCQRGVSPNWKIEKDRKELKYDITRRCTSASTLEPFQKGDPKAFDNSKELKSDKRLETRKTLILRTPDQVASADLILAEKALVQLEAKTLLDNLKRDRDMKRDESLVEPVTGKSKSHNGGRRKVSAGKEKWKFAVQKVRREKKKGEENSQGKIAGKPHTNANAIDEEVWSVLQSETRKKSLSQDYSAPKVRDRKLSLPAVLSNKESSAKIPSKSRETPILVRRTKIEEPSEIITELELTPRDDLNPNIKRSMYRPSIDSSMDSENSSRYEAKLFEVEVEINGLASVNSRSDSPVDKADDSKDKGVKKVGGENCFGGERLFCFENDAEEDEDDDDVITI